MTIYLEIPSTLRKFCGNVPVLALEAGTVDELIRVLKNLYSEFAEKIFDEEGNLKGFVSIYIGEESINMPKNGVNRNLPDGERITIISAIAGG